MIEMAHSPHVCCADERRLAARDCHAFGRGGSVSSRNFRP